MLTEFNRNPSSGAAIRPVDQLVLDLLRCEQGLTVPELIDRLEVTATAVRQRLERLVEMDLIERRKRSAGRGRPSFRYFLTSQGWRQVGATYVDLATALWKEVALLPDSGLRAQLMQSVMRRMGQLYGSQLPDGSLRDRMAALVGVLEQRKIPARLGDDGSLPVLEVQACPYPDLADSEDDRSVCKLEQQILTEALGSPMELSCCRLDGHVSCQFKPVAVAGS